MEQAWKKVKKLEVEQCPRGERTGCLNSRVTNLNIKYNFCELQRHLLSVTRPDGPKRMSVLDIVKLESMLGLLVALFVAPGFSLDIYVSYHPNTNSMFPFSVPIVAPVFALEVQN